MIVSNHAASKVFLYMMICIIYCVFSSSRVLGWHEGIVCVSLCTCKWSSHVMIIFVFETFTWMIYHSLHLSHKLKPKFETCSKTFTKISCIFEDVSVILTLTPFQYKQLFTLCTVKNNVQVFFKLILHYSTQTKKSQLSKPNKESAVGSVSAVFLWVQEWKWHLWKYQV